MTLKVLINYIPYLKTQNIIFPPLNLKHSRADMVKHIGFEKENN